MKKFLIRAAASLGSTVFRIETLLIVLAICVAAFYHQDLTKLADITFGGLLGFVIRAISRREEKACQWQVFANRWKTAAEDAEKQSSYWTKKILFVA